LGEAIRLTHWLARGRAGDLGLLKRGDESGTPWLDADTAALKESRPSIVNAD
jgi:hypothetical protein